MSRGQVQDRVGLLGEVDLGEFEFAAYRGDIDLDDRLERDTEEEAKLFKSLVRWVEDGKQPSESEYGMLVAAMRDPRYSAFFLEPRVVEVHRGISLDAFMFEKIMGDMASEAVVIDTGSVVGDWKLMPLRGSKFSSFSRNFSTAQRFSVDMRASESLYSVIFSAKIVDNPGIFFDVYEMTQKLLFDFDIDVAAESESIALGPVNVYKITWEKNVKDSKNRSDSSTSSVSWEEHDIEYGKNEY